MISVSDYIAPNVDSQWEGPEEITAPFLPFVESVDSPEEQPREYVEPFVGEGVSEPEPDKPDKPGKPKDTQES